MPTGTATHRGADLPGLSGADVSGGIGPSLVSGEVFERFPDRLSTIEFVRNGEGLMPAFGTRLTVGEIGAVSDFVRKELATQG